MNSSIGLVGLKRSIRDYAESPQQEPVSDQRFASKTRPTRHDLTHGIMEEYAELRAQRFIGACESGRLRPHAPLPASCRSRTPGGSSRRVLAGNRAMARRSRSLRRACSFLSASIECLLVVPFRSQRPAVGGVPGQLSRQNASLAFSVCHSRCLIWSLPVAPRSL